MIKEDKFAQKTLENYEKLYNESINEKQMENFWSYFVNELVWNKKPTKILDKSNPPFYKWFADGKLNFCYNALDRHVKAGLGNAKAIIGESAYGLEPQIIIYNELFILVNKYSKILIQNGIGKGDRVIIYMPMICEAIISIMACWRIGAIHSIVFGGFAPDELSDRINDCKPKMIITASCGIEPRKKINYYTYVVKALELAREKLKFNSKNVKILLYQREKVITVTQDEINQSNYNTIILNEELNKIKKYKIEVPCVALDSTDIFYILYTSGTTGTPKGICRDIGGTAITAYFTMKYILNLNKKDIIFSTSDIGWIVGHLFIIYGPLIVGATSIIYEGKPIGTPNCGKCFELIQKYNAKIFYTAPTVVRAYKKEDPECEIIHSYDISSLESVCLSGERCDPESFKFMQKILNNDNIVINDHWWQTESGYPICCNNINIYKFPNIPGQTGRPMLGFNLKILDINFNDKKYKVIKDINTPGILCIKLPTPPSFMKTLFNNDEAYIEHYLTKDKKYYITEDIGVLNENGNITILSRNDDMIKIAGHRLTTGRMEEVILNENKEISECAVVALKDSLKGEVPFAFLIVKDNVKYDDNDLITNVKNSIRNNIGAISSLKDCLILPKLPKTKSGKIIRKILRKLINNNFEEKDIPPTIEEKQVVYDIQKKLIEKKLIQ